GISASTLSVEISNSGSSFSTASPAFLSHLVIVPSKIDSPIWGMITSVGMDPSLHLAGLQLRARFQPDYKSRPIRQPNTSLFKSSSTHRSEFQQQRTPRQTP